MAAVSHVFGSWSSWFMGPPAVVATFVVVALYVVYRRGFPRPLPGIPYNEEAARRFTGDLPTIRWEHRHGDGFRTWLSKTAERHGSPLVQVFIRPWDRPYLVLCDYWAAQDIMLRRVKEFDRSTRNAETFGCILPDNRVSMMSDDPRLRRNQALTKDLMTPSFLNQVSAPLIHEIAGDLVGLWKLKLRLSGGRPFSAEEDLHVAALDMIIAAALAVAKDQRIMPGLIDKVYRTGPLGHIGETGPDDPVAFPLMELSPAMKALNFIGGDAMEVAFRSPWPLLHSWLLKKTKWRRIMATKEQFLTDEINKAAARIMKSKIDEEKGGEDKEEDGGALHGGMRSAVDNIILREIAAARKEGRTPDFQAPHMRDEITGYVVAGHDTTSRTLAWTVKTMAANPVAQAKLRRQLREAYPDAAREGRPPTAEEIMRCRAPYLDAFLEECLRVTYTFPLMIRESKVETTILGHRVPARTPVFICSRGPSFMSPALGRVPGMEKAKTTAVGEWDEETIGEFVPERWLKPREEEDGGLDDGDRSAETGEFAGVEYDSQAGPFLTFGAGPRGCFGKRLAYMEMRIVLVAIAWNFELLSCKPELSSWAGHEKLASVPRQCYVKLRLVAP